MELNGYLTFRKILFETSAEDASLGGGASIKEGRIGLALVRVIRKTALGIRSAFVELDCDGFCVDWC